MQPEHSHDHSHCLAAALAAAESLCASRGARLTAIRRRVLELVWSGHKAVKAYDILEELAHESASAKPPTVYRALDFLLEQGLIHRIESLNAFVGCPSPRSGHATQFLICDDCHTVIEMACEGLEEDIAHEADQHGFAVARQMVEVHGRCQRCAAQAGQAGD
ncbi:MAG: transcriptional repressor [Alphaproteobacteria bacterium]|nr:MAG: transcriptional repressor [Alphaproteobacteria bacterium]